MPGVTEIARPSLTPSFVRWGKIVRVPADVLVRFPPLPELPEPPVVGPDPRQKFYFRIVGTLTEATEELGRIQASNLATGYHACAPNLGVLKIAHEQALAHFDLGIIRARWEAELQRWLAKSQVRWVQRTKSISTELRANGIAVELEAQDDHGYYHYGFDLMIREAPVA
jgi:hypothetical protein